MKKILQKGFTLIELLIVIGILGILIAAVLFTLNPAEAQRKGRDVQRLRDLGTLQTVMENLVQDSVLTDADVSANSSEASEATDCASSWLGATIGTVCNYVSKVPKDPVNALTNIAGTAAAGACTSTLSSGTAYYYISYEGATRTYEIAVRQESAAGCTKLTGDGGNSNRFVEVGTALDIIGDI